MPERRNKADQVYAILEEMITFQELAPGASVSESSLMEKLGYGRTPVREALQRLARERMVEIHPHRGPSRSCSSALIRWSSRPRTTTTWSSR